MNSRYANVVKRIYCCGLFFAIFSKAVCSHAAVSTHAGYGSIIYNGGVAFRVWAPNASTVSVKGTFPGSPVALTAEGNGYWSVDVPNAVAGQQYKYTVNGTDKQDPRCRAEVSSVGNSIIYNTTNFNWTGDTFTSVPINDAVIYELNICSFNGNPGTFAVSTNLFPYLKQLGITAIEVMPINEFPGNFSWGYNPSDLFGIESTFGGPDGFKNFVKAAHAQGIGVLVDVVHNHYGTGDLDLWRFDGSFTAGGPSGGYGGIYFFQSDPYCCTPYGNTRPSYSTAQVFSFIQDTFTMWLKEYHVDGFRWDSPGYMMFANGNAVPNAQSLIQQTSAMIHTGYVGKINIGEDQGQLSGTSGFDSTWANVFYGNITAQLTTSSDTARNMGSIEAAVKLNTPGGISYDGWRNVLFMENHDKCGDQNGGQRLTVQIDGTTPTSYFARKRSTIGATLALTTPGLPMLLQGQEMLTTAQFSDHNQMDWSRTNTYSGIVSFYRDLIRLRRNLDNVSPGLKGLNVNTMQRDDANKLYAYRRWNTGSAGDDVVVICNFANAARTNYSVANFPRTGVWYVQLNSDSTKYSLDYGNFGSLSTTVSVNSATISIAPYSVLILSQNTPGAPPVPQPVTATTVSTNQINVAWGASIGATGYIVKRDGNQIVTTSTTNYSDIGLALGSTYCYTVAATNIGGASLDSSPACATTVALSTSTNLLAYWTFDEGGGTFAYDTSGNNNTGTVVGASWDGGMLGGAVLLDGVEQVDVPNSISLNPANSITVAAWVNAQYWISPSFTLRVVQKGKTDNQYRLYADSNSGNLIFDLFGVTNGNIGATLPSDNAWHHVAGTYDGSLISLYIDGQQVAQHAASGSLAITTDLLSIGGKPAGGGFQNRFAGLIDDVRIYGGGLTANQIVQLYNSDTVGDGIANWWRLQYFGNTSLTDATSCATCDITGTGQNNLFKFVAGLNPTDPTQVFTLQISPVTNQPGQMNLLFNPVAAGRTYTPQFSDGPSTNTYSDLLPASPSSTNGSQVTVTDLNAAPSNEFYRIHISLP